MIEDDLFSDGGMGTPGVMGGLGGTASNGMTSGIGGMPQQQMGGLGSTPYAGGMHQPNGMQGGMGMPQQHHMGLSLIHI